MDTKNKKKEKNRGQESKEGKNILEWGVFAISLLLVIGILSYLSYKTYTHKTAPPNIQVTYQPSPTENAPFRYHISIKNNGLETAEEVRIELVLKKGEATVEKAALQLPFLPQSSLREGWLNFSQDPQLADTVVARVVSFKKP